MSFSLLFWTFIFIVFYYSFRLPRGGRVGKTPSSYEKPWPRLDTGSCFWKILVLENHLILSLMKPRSEAQKHPPGMQSPPSLLVNQSASIRGAAGFTPGCPPSLGAIP